ncbi:MAG: tripartite tricarboxylate transporter substrate binding protein [Burkholderiales bacterium]
MPATPLVVTAQAWQPTRSIEIVVPAGPSGALDQAARILKQILDERKLTSQAVVISNRPGGGGKVAFNVLAQREGDAHVLSINTHGYLSNHITGLLDVLPHRDFTPIAVLLAESIVVAVRADSPVKNARDLADRLKARPESMPIGVATAVGNHIHIGIAKPLKAAGVDIGRLTVAAFRSSGDSMVALLGSHIDIAAASTPNVVTLYKAGKIRLLAVSSPERLGGALADVPTWREAGVDSVFQSAMGLLLPRGISPAQIAWWEQTLRSVTATEEWKRHLEHNQSRAHFLASAEAARFYESEYIAMRALVTDMGLAKQ